jgi:hypothetical protein
MIRFCAFFLSLAGALSVTANLAAAHVIPWPRGSSHQVGYGVCAKGPCTRRASFASSVPHRHTEDGWCIGMGAGGYTLNRRFKC